MSETSPFAQRPTTFDKRTGIPLVGAPTKGFGARVELESFITEKSLEAACVWVKEQASVGTETGRLVAERAVVLAERRDPKMLLALERGAEIMVRIEERERGRTQRDPSATPVDKVLSQEVQLWREAYVTCDRGHPVSAFAWIYAAAAKLAGLL